MSVFVYLVNKNTCIYLNPINLSFVTIYYVIESCKIIIE